jgi:hypothetical protein
MESAEERGRRLLSDYSRALPRVFGDPLLQGIGTPHPRLSDEATPHIAAYALGYIQELAARVRNCCEDPLQTEDAKRQVCQLLINVTREGAAAIHLLSREFLSPFREVAQTSAVFPCPFPAHPDDIRSLKNFILDDLELGKLHPLKLRSPLKTFSKKTAINALLLHYIGRIHAEAAVLLSRRIGDPFGFGSSPKEEVERLLEVRLSSETAPQWLDMIWKLLLLDCPKPEKHNLLFPLGRRQSRTERASLVKGKIRKTGRYVRAGIKEALGRYLVRKLRDQKQSDPDK